MSSRRGFLLPSIVAAMIGVGSATASAQTGAGTQPSTAQRLYDGAMRTLRLAPAPAPAAGAPRQAAPSGAVASPGIAAASTEGDIVDKTVEGVTGVVTALVSVFSVPDAGSSASAAARVQTAHGLDFWALVRDAGYELKEAETDVGLLPGFLFKFSKGRELSDADRVWLERKLVHHREDRTGLSDKVKRGIIHSLLRAHDMKSGLTLESFDIGFSPLPHMKFVVMPTDSRLLNQEHDTLYRVILGNRAITRQEGHGGAQGAAKPSGTK